MLVMLLAAGTVSASGGSSYSSPETIYVPLGTIDIWSGDCDNEDWYRFGTNHWEDVYIDLDNTFAQDGGEMNLHDDAENDIIAWVSSSSSNHWCDPSNALPCIEIEEGTTSDYDFIVGRYDFS
ncbi:hypothetical protein [Methanococcoides burtonii]|nr:hypothetical protein [Methanococcoides burtonii]